MANALSGYRLLLKTPEDSAVSVQDSPPTKTDFAEIGGFVTNGFDLSTTEVDVTSKSTGENRSLLDGHGIISLSFNGNGFLQNSAIAKEIERRVLSQELNWYLTEREDGRDFLAKFKLTSYSFDGEVSGAVNFSVTFQSSGTIYVRDENGQVYNTGEDKITAFDSLVNNFQYINKASEAYLFSELPDQDIREETLRTYLNTLSVLTTEAVSTTPTDDVELSGTNEAGKYSFPFLLLKASTLEGKDLQILDPLDENITDNFIYLSDVNDEAGDAWRAYYLKNPVYEDDTKDIKIMIG